MVSATFSVPSSHRALQFKGNDAHIVPLEAQDRAAVARYIDLFAEAIDPLHKSSLLPLGFGLFVLTFGVLVVARLMLMQLKRREGT